MRIVLTFFWMFLKKWWALMSCAAFTILSLVLAYVGDANKWLVRGTGSLAVLFLFVAFFQVWQEQHNRTLDAELKLKEALSKPPITSKDWKTLAYEAEAKCKYFRVDHHWTSANNSQMWHVTGGPRSEICENLIRQAGNMLLKSPIVSRELSDIVRGESDSCARWMRFMDEKGAFTMGGVGYGYEEVEGVRVNHYSTSTRDLVYDFVRLCEYCASLEI